MELQIQQKRKQYGGWKPKPLEERKVMVYGYIPRKFYNEAQQKINELLKQYRQ